MLFLSALDGESVAIPTDKAIGHVEDYGSAFKFKGGVLNSITAFTTAQQKRTHSS